MNIRAVVLVAGRSLRMGDLTENLPKSFLKIGDTTLIHRTIDILKRHSIDDITLVVGFKKELFMKEFPDLDYVVNPDFATTNTANSLYLGLKDNESKNVLVMNGDVYADEAVFDRIIELEGKNIATIKRHRLTDEEIKVFVKGNKIVRIGKYLNHNKAFAEAFGIYLLTPEFATYLKRELYLMNNPRMFYEGAMDHLLQGGHIMEYLDVGDAIVYELDFPEDYYNLLKLIGNNGN